jgi:hypothetical protein
MVPNTQMIWKRRGYVAGCVLGLSLALMACGSSEGGTDPVKTIPKAQLIKKGKAICDHGNEVINAEFSRWGTKNGEEGKIATEAELDAETAKVVLPIRKTQVRRLQALGMPDQDQRQFKKLLAAMEEGIEKGEEDRSSLRDFGGRYAFAKAFNLGVAFGLKSCWLEE